MHGPQICLASRSPRRRQLLEQIGVRYEVVAVDVSEVRSRGELPRDYVRRLALQKARKGWLARGRAHQRPVLGADTAVVLGDMVLGKPSDEDEALNMLARLSGCVHEVMTAIALVGEREEVGLSVSRVRFRVLSDAERRAYWESGEPIGKAGGYAIQGLAAVFISRLEGSYSGVMGLPLYETFELLRKFSIPLWDDAHLDRPSCREQDDGVAGL